MLPAPAKAGTYSALRPAWVFDDSPIPDPLGHGERAVRFLRDLRHPKSRLPLKAFQLDPPFERIVRRIYGPVDEHGARLTRTVYLQVGKGSRKTSLAAALALLHLAGPERVPRGENVVAAATRAQARLAFEEALAVVDEWPALSAASRPVDSKNRLHHLKTKSVFEAVSADGPAQHGRTPTWALVDELWAHKKSDLFHAIRTGVAKVPGSLLIVTTTAGRGREAVDYPVYDYARRVQLGEIENPHFLPILFEAPADCDWTDERVWNAVLPGLRYGYPDLPSLRQLADEARERPADREAFRQFYLGIRVDAAASPFVDMGVYDEGADPVDLEALAGAPCWLGVDLSSNVDLSVIVAAFRDGEGGYIVAPWFFCPSENLEERESRSGAPYGEWARLGLIEATPGTTIDYRRIEDTIRDLCQRFDVQEIAFDPHLARQVQPNLLEEGLPVVDFRQVPSLMMPALQELERAIVGRRFRHGGHPVLRASFAAAEANVNARGHVDRLVKSKRFLSIDGAVAAAMAVARAAAGGGAGSVYDDPDARPEGLLFV